MAGVELDKPYSSSALDKPSGSDGGGQENANADDSAGGGGGGGGGYSGGGGGGGGGTVSDDQINAAKSLEAITAFNAGSETGKMEHGFDALQIADQSAANNRDWQIANAGKQASQDWYSQQQKEQATTTQLRDRMGNAAYGSGLLDLADDIARVDDMADVQVLRSYEDNIDNAWQNYYETMVSNINARNELAMDTEASLRELFGDYAAQLNNISPKLASGEEGDNGTVIDKDARSINIPDWFQEYLDKGSYDKNKKGPGTMDFNKFMRPDESLEKIQEQGLDTSSRARSGSANRSYHTAFDTYQRR